MRNLYFQRWKVMDRKIIFINVFVNFFRDKPFVVTSNWNWLVMWTLWYTRDYLHDLRDFGEISRLISLIPDVSTKEEFVLSTTWLFSENLKTEIKFRHLLINMRQSFSSIFLKNGGRFEDAKDFRNLEKRIGLFGVRNKLSKFSWSIYYLMGINWCEIGKGNF
jgi:hypothetical protein